MRGMRTSIRTSVGRAAVGERDGLDAVRGLADDLDVGLGFEDRAQPAADDRLVVGEEHADGRHRGVSRSLRARRGQHRVDAPAEAVGVGPGVEPAAHERGALAHAGDAAAAGRRARRAARRRRLTSMKASPLVRWIDTAARGGRA